MSDVTVGQSVFWLESLIHGHELTTDAIFIRWDKVRKISYDEKTGTLVWMEDHPYGVELEALYTTQKDCIGAFRQKLEQLC